MSTARLSRAGQGPSSASRPDRTTRKPRFSCSQCGCTSDSLSSAHCASCHHHFIGISVFDLHRAGSIAARRCLDPATALRRDGTRMFAEVQRVGGRVWRRARRAHESSHPFGSRAAAA